MSEIKGLKELSKALKAFPQNVQNNILNSAVRAGAVTIQKEAKKNVPVKSGLTKASIIIKKRRPKSKNITKFSLGIRRIKDGREWYEKNLNSKYFKDKPKDAYYAHMIEFGTSKSEASPFMRPALESRADEVINEVRKKMQQRIDKEIERSKNA
jgi:HK97 gp10 family phage protein